MTPDTFRQNLATLLRARGALSSVDVFEYPPGAQAKRKTTVFLTDENGSVDRMAYTNTADEQVWTIDGSIYAMSGGPADSQWRTAEAAARTVFNELRDQLQATPTVNGACANARLISWSGSPSQDDQGTVFFDISFTIQVLDVD